MNTMHPAIQQMLPQLLIAIVKRNGGELTIPVSEVDDTGQDVLYFSSTGTPDSPTFTFTVKKKQ